MTRVLNLGGNEEQEMGLDDPGHYCCEGLRYQLVGTANCRDPEGHSTGTVQCPKQVVIYIAQYREYQISPVKLYSYTIQHCPWCGARFPEELREKWFDVLEAEFGIKDPFFEGRARVPDEFRSDQWWKKRGL